MMGCTRCMRGDTHEHASTSDCAWMDTKIHYSLKKKANERCMRLAMERTALLIDGLTRRNVGYFAWSRRAGEPAIKPIRTRSTISSPAIVAISIVGFDEEEPTRPLTPSILSPTSAFRASASCRCVSRTRTSIYKTTTSVLHTRYM